MMGTGERMLIKKTKSLCPTCGSVLDADIVEEEGKVWLVRTLPRSRHVPRPLLVRCRDVPEV